MVDIIGTTAQYWIQYIFGSTLIAGLVLMFFIALWGMKRNWSLDMYLVVFVPLTVLMSTTAMGGMINQGYLSIVLILVSIIIGLGIIKLTR